MNTLHNRLLIFSSELVAPPSIELLLGQRLYLTLEIEPAKPGASSFAAKMASPSPAPAPAARALPAPDSLGHKRQRIAQLGVFALTQQPGVEVQNRRPDSQVKQPNTHSETWWFNTDERTLVKAETTIALTTIESLMLVQLVISECRVLSRDDLIQRIEKDPQRYSGLEMCLSRLQKKFKSAAHGERLVRSVRNRGYCLTQRIKMA